MAELFANSGDPDQMPHSVASALGLHCSPVTILGLCRLKWVKSASNERMIPMPCLTLKLPVTTIVVCFVICF